MTNGDAVRSALYTALWTFVGVFGASLLGWFQDLASWASDDGGTVVFPDPSVLVKAAVAAVTAALSGVVGLVVRLAQANGLIAGKAPVYQKQRIRPLRANTPPQG